MANSQDSAGVPHPDLLAAVVLHSLVTKGRDGITSERVAVACERDPDERADMAEIEAALELLCHDGLAERGAESKEDEAERGAESKEEDRAEREGEGNGGSEGEGDLFRPTRAAVRAAELSF